MAADQDTAALQQLALILGRGLGVDDAASELGAGGVGPHIKAEPH